MPALTMRSDEYGRDASGPIASIVKTERQQMLAEGVPNAQDAGECDQNIGAFCPPRAIAVAEGCANVQERYDDADCAYESYNLNDADDPVMRCAQKLQMIVERDREEAEHAAEEREITQRHHAGQAIEHRFAAFEGKARAVAPA